MDLESNLFRSSRAVYLLFFLVSRHTDVHLEGKLVRCVFDILIFKIFRDLKVKAVILIGLYDCMMVCGQSILVRYIRPLLVILTSWIPISRLGTLNLNNLDK